MTYNPGRENQGVANPYQHESLTQQHLIQQRVT